MSLDLQNQILNTPEEAHAAQDGATLGILFSLTIIFPAALFIPAAALGLDSITVRKLTKKVDDLVRVDEIQNNPEYFIIPYTVTSIPGIAWALYYGVTIPF